MKLKDGYCYLLQTVCFKGVFATVADLDAARPTAPQKAPSTAAFFLDVSGLRPVLVAIPSPSAVCADGISKQSYPPFLPSSPDTIDGYV